MRKNIGSMISILIAFHLTIFSAPQQKNKIKYQKDFEDAAIKEIKENSKASGVHCMAVEYERLFNPLLGEYPDYAKNFY